MRVCTNGSARHPAPALARAVAARRGVACGAAAPTKPGWTGDTLASRLANWAINTPWMYGIMKVAAKNQMKKMTSSAGVPWDEHVVKLQSTSELEAIRTELEDKDLKYPEFYLKPFHAYDEGNLCWLAAYEVEPASYAVALRAFRKIDPNVTAAEAYRLWRSSATNAVKEYYDKHQLEQPKTILDVGCSVGMSTRWLADTYPAAEVRGIDMSPYFLSIAEYEERKRQSAGAGRRVTYVHGNVLDYDLPENSVDMMAIQYVIHECPQEVIQGFCEVAARAVRPGGCFFVVDNNPKSKTIQGLPPAIALLMKSTEPWSDEFYAFDLEAAMRAAGFDQVVKVETDHRHCTVMGIKR